MKRFLVIIFAVCSALPVAARPVDVLWDEGNTAYLNGDYAGALAAWDSIAAAGWSGYKLYYNMGNAHFKAGNIGGAVLYYQKSALLRPGDADVAHNLEVTGSYAKDRIEEVPRFFLSRWLSSLGDSTGPDTWAVVGVIMLAVAFAAALAYLFGHGLALRKAGFYGAAGALVLFILALSFSLSGRSRILHSDDAVVMASAAPVKSSPDNASKDIFILHEGTQVRVLGSLGQWSEIEIADGHRGWIAQGHIEMVR